MQRKKKFGHGATDRIQLLVSPGQRARIETGQRADMGDAAAHLPGADHADMADLGRGSGGVAHDWRFPSSSSSSGRILNRSPTMP